MSTHNIQFHDKIRKFPLVFVFLSYRKNFKGTQKRVRINHGKRAIGVRAIKFRLYLIWNPEMPLIQDHAQAGIMVQCDIWSGSVDVYIHGRSTKARLY